MDNAPLAEDAPFLGNETSESAKKTRFQVKKIDFNLSDQKKDKEEEQSSTHSTESGEQTEELGDKNGASYETQYLKSLRNYTREALPRVAHYRNTLTMHTHHDRPTLEELHNPSVTLSPSSLKLLPNYAKKSTDDGGKTSAAIKLGWVQGVFIRCLLNIWGVMLFLRLTWVVGQAGVFYAVLVILLATLVTLLTTVSMSAICTNGEVKGGGAYYMISRSLGPEFGGAIGAIFSLANAVAIAMYVVGFCESVISILKENDMGIIDAGIQDIRIIGVIVVTILLGISIIGMEWENKAQLGLLVILLTAMVCYVVGSFIPPTPERMAKGFVGVSIDVLTDNLGPDYRGESFISVFAVIFPAATGILAGANISGDLSNPSKAIPKGTFLAILATTISYIVFMILSGLHTIRDANGVLGLTDISKISNCSLAKDKICHFGLQNSEDVIVNVSPFGWIIYGGIFAASLSSALASLVSAPKIFQALCKDRLFPYIHVFARGFGKSDEPRLAYVLAYIIAIACILIGRLNLIAPIISNFFLAAYCIVNFSCFHASSTNSPGFRPAFRYYNKWISLLGALLCMTVMFIINWSTALMTFALVLFLYIFIYYRKPDVNWGSSNQAEIYMRALRAIKKTVDIPDHVKTYRPQVLVLIGCPSHRPALLDFANSITRKISLLVCGDIQTQSISNRTRRMLRSRAHRFFEKRKVDAFYELKQDKSFAKGARALMELSGLGKLRPNLMLIGYKNNWEKSTPEDILDYFTTIHSAFDLHFSVCVLRVPQGLDFSDYEEAIEKLGEQEKKKLNQESKITEMTRNISDRDVESEMSRNASGIQLSNENTPSITPAVSRSNLHDMKTEGGIIINLGNMSATMDPSGNMQESKSQRKESGEMISVKITRPLTNEVLNEINLFQRKQRKGTIDVWWLYDDGGLTMLLPYLLSTRYQWDQSILRVFTLANRKDELDLEKRNMAALLNKFRIDFQDVIVVPDVIKPPKSETMKEFESLISNFREDEVTGDEGNECIIRESELLALKDKNNRHMRLRELLLEHSSNATLIVMTLSVPRRGTCSAPLFMSWLEMLTKDMPPFLLVRGNQQSVLTFYS